jgi:hypothetical protein
MAAVSSKIYYSFPSGEELQNHITAKYKKVLNSEKEEGLIKDITALAIQYLADKTIRADGVDLTIERIKLDLEEGINPLTEKKISKIDQKSTLWENFEVTLNSILMTIASKISDTTQ